MDAMQTYFFHIVYDNGRIEDPEGSDFPDLEAACAEAKAIIRDLAAEHLTMGKPFALKCVRIGSQSGRVLREVSAAQGISDIIPPSLFAEGSSPQA